MTSRTDKDSKKKGGIPWFGYFAGGVIYIILAIIMFKDATWPVLIFCALSAPLGFYFAWVAWKRDKQNKDDA
jgi:hypothetical protein